MAILFVSFSGVAQVSAYADEAKSSADVSADSQVKPQANKTMTKKKKRKIAVAQDSQSGEPVATSTAVSDSFEESNDPLAKVQIRPIISYSFLNPVAVNSVLSAQTVKLFSSPYKIGAAATLSLAADYAITSHFNVGARMDWFSSSTALTQITQGTQSFANLQSSVSALPVYATATYIQPLANHLDLAFCVGVGLPVFFTESTAGFGLNFDGTSKRCGELWGQPVHLDGLGCAEL